ncbi:dithiol-disulfide isomerase [Halalkalibacillus sediminis]|uniref:ClpXP adapter protein SpxH n=2 Tax=Halalkalibacillus sediminis TaxID=2018042 RepID=A0A2I0QYE8_9BACI|nr:dithiol-disulfide isomerase [Halalkalibacillus sediminis]
MINLASNDNSQVNFCNLLTKPVEIYVFIDPLCPECWSLEPYIRKLAIEYGCYFKLRPIVTGNIADLNFKPSRRKQRLANSWDRVANRTGMSCDGDLWYENPIHSPWTALLAIKAAEMQGQRLGSRFLRKLQEYLFLDKKNITDVPVLIEIADKVNLDVEEFKKDIYSTTAERALQCDLKLTREMEVEQVPTIVMFNREEDQDGLKVSGLHNYETYEKALFEVMEREARPSIKPCLEDFLSHFNFVASKEVAVVFDWPIEKAEKEMKKLQLAGKVGKVPVKYGTFWKYHSNAVKSHS